jgi:AcrR family transcriptional regulator
MVMTDTKTRIVREAIRLFAERGYTGTSIADIQHAAGLRASSGALYKHFTSKSEVLEAVARAHIDDITVTMQPGDAEIDESIDLLDQLAATAQAVWDGISHGHQLMRVLYRDLENAPAALDDLWAVVDQQVFERFNRLIEHGIQTGQFRDIDAPQAALLLASAVIYIPTANALIHRTPRQYTNTQDYLHTWRDTAARLLT